jgi:hypothetical protein
MTDERAVLVLAPAKYGGHDDAIITADCGHRAYISSGGIQTQARMDARTICMDCCDPADVPEVQVPPEVYAELVERLGQEQADHLIELTKNPANRRRMFGPNNLPSKFHRLFGTSPIQ